MANYIVGDLQGYIQPLIQLLEKVSFDPNKDTLWAVGDLIGRGPEPLQTLRYLKNLDGACKVVLGNHDLHFLSVYSGIKKNKKSDNFSPLLMANDCSLLVDWLRCQPLVRKVDEQHLMVHAGLYPMWSGQDALKYSSEAAEQLQGKDWQTFLSVMYGNTPSIWHDVSTQEECWRFIINACTRMRYLTKSGELELIAKMPPEDAPRSLIPWFSYKAPLIDADQKVLFGHWASLAGDTESDQFIGLDTGYLWGGSLTLFHLESGRRFQLYK
jgi:bis(5'-nucleosyl)-tetraphosphatase (symmetrical)